MVDVLMALLHYLIAKLKAQTTETHAVFRALYPCRIQDCDVNVAQRAMMRLMIKPETTLPKTVCMTKK